MYIQITLFSVELAVKSQSLKLYNLHMKRADLVTSQSNQHCGAANCAESIELYKSKEQKQRVIRVVTGGYVQREEILPVLMEIITRSWSPLVSSGTLHTNTAPVSL